MEYTLKSGKKLTDKVIACLNEAIEHGDLSVLTDSATTAMCLQI